MFGVASVDYGILQNFGSPRNDVEEEETPGENVVGFVKG